MPRNQVGAPKRKLAGGMAEMRDGDYDGACDAACANTNRTIRDGKRESC